MNEEKLNALRKEADRVFDRSVLNIQKRTRMMCEPHAERLIVVGDPDLFDQVRHNIEGYEGGKFIFTRSG